VIELGQEENISTRLMPKDVMLVHQKNKKNCAEHYKAIVVDGVTLRTNCLTTEELSVLNKIIER